MRGAGFAQPNVLEGAFEQLPHYFVEKQTLLVQLPQAFVIGADQAIPFTYCEVFAPTWLMTNVSTMHCSCSPLISCAAAGKFCVS